MARRHKTIRAEQIEELDKRPGRAAVFFYNGNLVVPADANGREFGEQKDALDAFRKSFTGLSKTYTNTDDLSTEVRNQLENWASDLAGQQPHTLLAAYSQLWKTEYITKYVNDASGKVTLLIYNTELQGFRSEVDFNEIWSCLNGRGPISSIVFLLPAYKIERLREYLSNICDTIGLKRLKRFSVCKMQEASEQAEWPSRLISSLTFVLVRFGSDPANGPFFPIADLMLLCEPFSSAGKSGPGTPDLQWTHKCFLETQDERMQSSLRELWQSHFDNERTVPVTTLIKQRQPDYAIDKRLKDQISVGPTLQEHETVVLVKQLREKLFDPNVPSYLMNKNYEMLDWNPAFELVFPTHKFYRNESVKQFAEVLDNDEDVKRRGAIRGQSAARCRLIHRPSS